MLSSSTPPAEDYLVAIQDTWHEIPHGLAAHSLLSLEFDDTRHDFEYHDHRDHGWYFGGKGTDGYLHSHLA